MKEQEKDRAESKERERCVVCGKDTGYTFSTLIQNRQFYVEGVGQVCKQCFVEIYFQMKNRP